jgi:putative transposase
LNRRTFRTGHVFGGPYHWSLIQSSRYFGHALKYVYRNPVKAGLCERVEQYPYSSLYGLLGSGPLLTPMYLTRVGMEVNLPSIDAPDLLGWFNRPFPKEAEMLIQKGLRKRFFEAAVCRSTRKPSVLLESFL